MEDSRALSTALLIILPKMRAWKGFIASLQTSPIPIGWVRVRNHRGVVMTGVTEPPR